IAISMNVHTQRWVFVSNICLAGYHMARSPAEELGNLIKRLQQERQDYLRKIEEIDRIFEQHGIQPQAGAARRGRPRGSAGAGGRRRRRRFEVSGTQSILNLVKAAGSKGVSSAEITKHWKSEGRSGLPYIALGQLVKARKLKK